MKTTRCVTCEEGEQSLKVGFWLQADYSVECYTPKYERYSVWAGIFAIVFVFGVPVLFWYLVYRFQPLALEGDKVVQSALGWMASYLFCFRSCY